jgi:cellulose synthase/poly-beta-1,6-N-acetylglucosamine synthase-like glycosyltransferase
MVVLNRCSALLFWVSIGLPFYSYAVFPMLIVAMSRVAQRRRSPLRPSERTSAALWPPAAIVVSAYNEEQHVAELVNNIQSLEYPGPVTLYVGSDGSIDRTATILQSLAGARVRVFLYEQNRGKASVLNDLLAATSEPIIAFTDANTRLEPPALARLVRHFDNPAVGAVCGELRLRTSGGGDNVDGVYWRIERLLKASESVLGALLGANGGIYAIRRECFVPLRPDTVVDDFCIAMTIAAAGRSLVYEPDARAVEEAPQQIRDEFKRRVRIGIGNYQAFFRHPEYFLRTGAMTRFAYFSHKVLRWFTPHLLILALLANAVLMDQPVYRALGAIQLGTYAFCLIVYALGRWLTIPRILRLPVYLVAMNVAFGIGFCRYLSGRYAGSWTRTARA